MNNELQIQIVQNLVPVLTADITIGGGQNITFGDTMTGAGTPTDPVNVSNDVLQQISDNTEQGEQNASQIADIQNNLSNIQGTVQNATEQISEIQSVIPATANAQNQLADQGFVNSSIQTSTAYFRGDWATWADVPNAPALYPVDANGNRTPTTNDYLVVIADEQTNGGTWRYKYTGLWSEQGKSGWQAEYQVNETPFTAAQNAAINSGVTAQAVADIAANKAAVATLQTSKQNKLTAGDGIIIDGDTISTSGGGASLPDQTGNAGKFLTTDGETASWGGDRIVQDNARFLNNGFAVGSGSEASASGTTAVGKSAKATAQSATAFGSYSEARNFAVAVGESAKATAVRAVQIGTGTNSDANTFKVANANGNFEMMDEDGNVPLGRLTYVTNQIGDISTALTAILGE